MAVALALAGVGCRRAAVREGPAETSDALLRRRCAAGGTDSARVLLPRPAGVEAVPEAATPDALRAEAVGWRMPPGVRFALSTPERRGAEGVLRGALVNEGAAPQRVILLDAGVGSFTATLLGEGLRRRHVEVPPEPGITPPPHLLPEPRAYVLAPGARWPFALTVWLGCWSLDEARSVKLHWWLSVAGDALQGDLPLPPR